jgi:hypothetical protein
MLTGREQLGLRRHLRTSTELRGTFGLQVGTRERLK